MRATTLSAHIRRLRKLAAADDWGRREEAGFTLRDLIEEHFADGIRLTEDWVADTDERVRRAVCLSCMQRKGRTTEDRLPVIYERLTRLMRDDSLYVRKCCGPFVVGYLGYTYPTSALPWLRGLASHNDFNVRANVAKAFSQALGRRFPSESLEILSLIGFEDSRRVRTAVESAVRNIVRSPEGAALARRKVRSLVARLAAHD